MMRFLLFTVLSFLTSNLTFSQENLPLGPDILDDGAGYYQTIKGKNDHYFFQKSFFRDIQFLRVYDIETNSLVEEYKTSSREENTFALSSNDSNYYYLIQVDAEVNKITLMNSENEAVSTNTFSREIDGHAVHFSHVGEMEGKEILLFAKDRENFDSYVFTQVEGHEISSSLETYVDLTSNGYSSILQLDGRQFALSREEDRKTKSFKVAELTNDLEFAGASTLSFSADYYTKIQSNKYAQGAVVFGDKFNYNTSIGEFFLSVDGNFKEFTVPLKAKMTLRTDDIFQFENYFLVLGTYTKKKEVGYFSIKVNYSGEVIESSFNALYTDYKSDAKPKMDDLNFKLEYAYYSESDQSITTVMNVIETYTSVSGEHSVSYATHTNAIKLDNQGKIIWRNDLRLNSISDRSLWGSFYAMHDDVLYIAYGENNVNIAVKTISNEGEEIETTEYKADQDFSYQSESRLFDDGLLVLKCAIGARKGIKAVVRFAHLQLW